ncbi:Ig-like protein group 2 [Pseudomonas baetica]|uniref:Ig-like protein group 2 n=1 Tax=Pseudomonas baetica TaxID=674054 RepID=A0ABX4PR48_9PSED|nr:Ig-like domain-containing protein [Pseudomonas baetica]PKA67494.1 Ig-like protein group 2 [Pseudomonas baetica]PTC18590.1 hypothetical protein C0J26_21650 [Pseudomonas baetica]
MSIYTLFTLLELKKMAVESPQEELDPFAEYLRPSLFMENGATRLVPIDIPGKKSVVFLPATYGISADKTAVVGWFATIHAYINQQTGDTLRMYRGNRLEPGQNPDPAEPGTLIKTEVVPEDHKDRNMLTTILDIFFDRPGIYPFWYTIERPSGQGPEPSERINIWVKTTYPDSLDPTGKSGERVALLPPVFPRSIDKQMVEDGIDVIVPKWSIMTRGDVIKLTIGDQDVLYTITAEQEGQEIKVPVPSEVLKAIQTADPLLVSYIIQDQVSNISRNSAIGVGTLDPKQNWLEAPSLGLAQDDVLDLDDLHGEQAQCHISVRRSDAIPADQVELIFSDKASGFTETYGPVPYKTGVVTFPIAYALLQRIAPSTITLKYNRIRVEGETTTHTPSFPYCPRLIAEKYRAPAPSVPQAQGAVLAPELKEIVVYAGPDIKGIKISDYVTLTIITTSAGGTTRLQTAGRYVTESMDIPQIGFVIPFIVDTDHFGSFPGATINLSYEISGEGHIPALESHIRRLRIGPVSNVLDIVDVAKDDKGILDPKDIPFGTPATCPSAGRTQLNDIVRFEVWRQGDNLETPDTLIFADSLPITAHNVGRDLEFWLDLELIQSQLHHVIHVIWHIERPRELPLTAPPLILRIGAKALSLSAPVLLEAGPGDVINPMDTRINATVTLAFTGMDPKQRITLFIKGREGFGSPAIDSVAGSKNGTLRFVLPRTVVAANIGTFLSIWYVVSQEGIPDQTSPATKYRVTDIPEPNLHYPGMSITEAVDHEVLNLNNFKGDAHWALMAWLFIAIGTRMRVALSGVTNEDNEYVLMLFDGVITANHVNTGLSGVIKRDDLALFKDGTLVYCLAISNFSNKGGVDTFFPVKELTIKTLMLAPPVITQVNDRKGPKTGPVANGGTCDDPAPELVGTAAPGTDVELYNDKGRIGIAKADKDGIWQAIVNIGFGRHNLVAKLPNNQFVSNTWIVTVANDLSAGNNASLYLPYLYLVPGRPPLHTPPGSIHSQPASGGSGPYSYSSSNTGIAKILDANGRVAAIGNGTATITVTDQSGQRASYILTIYGIKNVTFWGYVTWHGHLQHQWRPYCLTLSQFQTFWQTYASVGNIPAYFGWPQSIYWTSTNNDYVYDVAWAFNLNNGSGFQHSPGGQPLPTLRVY